MFDNDFDELVEEVARLTGFTCYETQPGSQLVFYGTSDKLNDFKELVGNILPTGTVAYTMDDGEQIMYSRFEEAWY